MTALDAALTTWINGWAGHVAAADVLMTWISALGIPVLVLAVAVQWWLPCPDRSRRHVLVAAGLSFLLCESERELDPARNGHKRLLYRIVSAFSWGQRWKPADDPGEGHLLHLLSAGKRLGGVGSMFGAALQTMFGRLSTDGC